MASVSGTVARVTSPQFVLPPGKAPATWTYVRHGLAGGDAVVLPDRDAGGVVGADDRMARPDHVCHDCGLLLGREVQDGLAVRYRDNEEVSSASLLVHDEHGRALLAVEDRVGAFAREVLAERTWTRWGKHECMTAMLVDGP